METQEDPARRLATERAWAAMRGDEYAEALDLSVRWEPVAPLAHVLAGGSRAVVVFFADLGDPDADPHWVRMVDTRDERLFELGLIVFNGCLGLRTGGNALLFRGRGLVDEVAHVIKNSRWLEEFDVPGVHHFFLPFATGAVECLAANITVELIDKSIRDGLSHAVSRLLA